VLAVFLGVVSWLVWVAVAALAEPAGAPIVPDYALGVTCDEPTYPDEGACYDANDDPVDMTDGTREGHLASLWRGDSGSGYKWAPTICYISGGTYGTGWPYVEILRLGGTYYMRYISTFSSAGSAGCGVHWESGHFPSSTDGFSSGSGAQTGYLFVVSDPATVGDCTTEFATWLGDPTEVTTQAYAGCTDPGEEPPPTTTTSTTTTVPHTPTLRVYLPDGQIEETQTVTLLLADAFPEAAPVSCAGQNQLGVSPITGNIAEGGTFTFEYTWATSGVYGVECSWVDGGTTLSARVSVTVGTGLDEVLGGDCDCGAWYHISCHMGCVLKWAFVPDGDYLQSMWSDTAESVSGSWPVGPLTTAIGSVANVVEDMGHGVQNPGYYGPSGLSCDNGPVSEACTLGLLISSASSYSSQHDPGARNLFEVIHLGLGPAGGEEGVDVPAFRILGPFDAGSAPDTWAWILRNILGVTLVLGAAMALIDLGTWIMGKRKVPVETEPTAWESEGPGYD
jgi:hypothetical protein